MIKFKRIDFVRLTEEQKEKILSGQVIEDGDLTEEQWGRLAMLAGEYTNGENFEECLAKDGKNFNEWILSDWN